VEAFVILKDKRIFVVEDNPQNRVIFQVILTQYGASVTFERSGKFTVSRLQNTGEVDLIILDLMLPDHTTGFDLYDEIRTLPHLDVVPIVAVSAMDPAVAIPRVRARGFAGFIAKPIDKSLFPKQIADLIAGEPVWHTGEMNVV
jgi:CheY-like chemotaxis protein